MEMHHDRIRSVGFSLGTMVIWKYFNLAEHSMNNKVLTYCEHREVAA
jgi:hypothetical protein